MPLAHYRSPAQVFGEGAYLESWVGITYLGSVTPEQLAGLVNQQLDGGAVTEVVYKERAIVSGLPQMRVRIVVAGLEGGDVRTKDQAAQTIERAFLKGLASRFPSE